QLRPWGTLGVVPLFAFFNSGVSFSGVQFETLFNKASVGIMAGLFLGKQLGIFGTAWMAVKRRLAELPEGIKWSQLY
ncbi:Na(+)/H(+) antiporter NhaA, partial [Candidatus Bathyarchaeota archaeon]|nr:Na(+)/H(+) antiporter NhaA [Candidatus Bathyarchaeota archaeon]